ncbi:MAG: coenzyme F420-0:L-glutamate ligase [Candidatus Gottesmanbacteria bacterium]
MEITVYKTRQVVSGDSLHAIIDAAIPTIVNGDIVVVTSKIVSICQGRIQKATTEEEKFKLIRDEAQYYIENDATRRYHMALTVTANILIPNSGIDESNGNAYYILWPKNPMEAAKELWMYLKEKHQLDTLGVIITDSHTTPLRWGTTGIGIAWCGFAALNNYIGKPDIFGRPLEVTKANILDGLSAAAVVVMGEGNEQTPLALIRNTPFVQFQNQPPTKEEADSLIITLDDDLYSPILTSAPWKKGNATK